MKNLHTEDITTEETAMKFIKWPVAIDAIQYQGVANLQEVLDFTGKHPNFDRMFSSFDEYCKHVAEEKEIFKIFTSKKIFKIFTFERVVEVLPGDWIIRDINGEHHSCKPDVFKKTYKVAGESFGYKLRALCGYVEDGSDTVVKIYQNDATRSWCVTVGGTVYSDEDSMVAAINAAYEKLEARDVQSN
jgi:hypothetical protein